VHAQAKPVELEHEMFVPREDVADGPVARDADAAVAVHAKDASTDEWLQRGAV
jgi:hypothetical protein